MEQQLFELDITIKSAYVEDRQQQVFLSLLVSSSFSATFSYSQILSIRGRLRRDLDNQLSCALSSCEIIVCLGNLIHLILLSNVQLDHALRNKIQQLP